MPKRSNQFQKIVTYIARQLAPLEAIVRESVELPEAGAKRRLREVDTLIEVGAGLSMVRVAIESRDRKRKDDIQWIDELIGKYALLPVDKVVAVSSSGFSAAAREKAQRHNIELLSPQEVAGTDWPAKFQRIGVASLVSRLDLVFVRFDTTPSFPRTVSLEDRLVRDDGVEGTVKEFMDEVRPAAIAGVREYINDNFLMIYKTLEDVKKLAVIERTISASDLSLVVGELRYRINKVMLRLVARNEPTIASLEHRVLGEDALLSSGRIGELDIVLAQTASATAGQLFLRAVPTPKRRPRLAKNLS